jgi:indolepyruvate ferredoxin oxidoreductase, alpha subunit
MITFEKALVLGILDSDVKLITGYPGYPVTTIFEMLEEELNTRHISFPEARWCINETVALENAMGASFINARTVVLIKNHGTNTVQDPLINLSYIGVGGGMIIISADDVGVKASQNETDSRLFGQLNMIPVLEPADVKDAYSFINMGFELSERNKTPVILRLTGTQLLKKAYFEKSNVVNTLISKTYNFNILEDRRFFIGPYNFQSMKEKMADRIYSLSSKVHKEFNSIILRRKDLAVIVSGDCVSKAELHFKDATLLKFGLVYPISYQDLEEFLTYIVDSDKVYIIEQTEPVIENQVREFLYEHHLEYGKKIIGKQYLTSIGEISEDDLCKISSELNNDKTCKNNKPSEIGSVKMCPQCPARAMLLALKMLKIKVMGDAGCTALGCLPPFDAVHSGTCMGASIATAAGVNIFSEEKVIALIGDSAFLHSGIQGLLNEVSKDTDLLTIIFNNNSAAMTGGQKTALRVLNVEDNSKIIRDMLIAYGLSNKSIKIISNCFDLSIVKNEIFDFYYKIQGIRVLIIEGCCGYNLKEFYDFKVEQDGEQFFTYRGKMLDPGCYGYKMVDENNHKIYKKICGECNICQDLMQN